MKCSWLVVLVMVLLILSACATPTPGSPVDNQTKDAFTEARKRMVVEDIVRRGISHPRVLEAMEKVLEIGTGSGYQAAILAEITDEVYSVEIIEPLGQQAEARLKELGYNVHCKIDDGYYGWEEHASFDAIIVTCAPDHIPQLLTKQLKDGGRLVIPVGPPGFYQTLWLIVKEGKRLQLINLGGVRFVPMLGEH